MRLLTGIFVVLLASCKPDLPQPEIGNDFQLVLPAGFPEMSIPADNQLTADRVALGKLLFYDTRLSNDLTISCGSCHDPNLAFADDIAVSPGVDQRIGFRNAPTLANVGYKSRLFADGGVSTLEFQVLAPMDSHEEMDISVLTVVDRLKADAYLNGLAFKAYGRAMDPFVVTRSIAAFERTMISGNSPYDRYLNGDVDALSPSATAGMNLFFSEALACNSCHAGHLLSDEQYYNVGLTLQYTDNGRERITANPADNGKFMTPTLRNIALTAPYMHDGSIASLEDVIEHFNSGGVNHPLKDEKIQPLNLTFEEKEQLLSFLTSLTDTEFTQNQAFYPN